MSSYLPKPPSNPLSDFGVALQTTLHTHMQGIDAELSNEDDSKDDFFKNVCSIYHLYHSLIYKLIQIACI